MSSDSFLFDFTDEDLVANRDGYMTKRQRSDLPKRMWRRYIAPILGAWAIISAGACILLAVRRAEATFIYLTLLLVTVGFGVALWERYFWQRRMIKDDLQKGDVSFVDGIVRLHAKTYFWRPKREIGEYELYIGQQKFDLTRNEFKLMRDHRFYYIYYLPNSRLILSFEEVQ